MASYDPTMEWPRTLRQMLVYGSFYGVFLAMGVFLVWFANWYFWWEQWRMNTLYLETSGVVVGKREVLDDTGLIPQVRVRYRAGDSDRENWNLRCGSSYLPDFPAIKIGDQRSVWFDPANPNRVITERGYAVLWWLFLPIVTLGLLLTVFASRTILRGISAMFSTAPPQQEPK